MSPVLYTPFLCAIVAVVAQKEECSRDGSGVIHTGIGTVLFTSADEFKQCWSPDEIATLTARMIMEDLLPDVTILNIDSNSYTDDIVGYFRLLIEVVKKSTHGRKKRITLLVLTDLLGGYLQYAVLPIARRAFYAGLIDYNSMEKLMQLFEELKWYLRTSGQGWSKPIDVLPDFEVTQIDFESEAPKVKSCCNQLIFYEYEHRIKQDNKTITRSDIAYPMPFFDTSVKPSSVAVPFKKFALRGIESRRASYFLFKFFVTASQCLNERSSTKDAKLKFQNGFFTWLQGNVVGKLKDDKFYSAFGGILRVMETLKSLGAVTHVDSTCSPEGEEELAVPESGTHRSFTSNVVLAVMLVIILIWFIIGTAFVCLRMKRSSTDSQPKKDYTSTEESKWSNASKSSNKTDSSIGICRCSMGTCSSSITSEYEDDKNKKRRSKQQAKPGDKSVKICYPPFMGPYVDNNKPAVLETRSTMKKLPSIEEIAERRDRDDGRKSSGKRTSAPSSRKQSWDNVKKKIKPGTAIDECWCDLFDEENELIRDRKSSPENKGRAGKQRPSKGRYHRSEDSSNQADSQKDERTIPSQLTTGDDEESPRRPPTILESTDEASCVTDKEGASPHSYACHSSLTGAYAKEKSPVGGAKSPYIFGYDLRSSTSSECSDDDDATDAKTHNSK